MERDDGFVLFAYSTACSNFFFISDRLLPNGATGVLGIWQDFASLLFSMLITMRFYASCVIG
ncbi:hypothetical protein B4168_4005 [Anoxybacillus flavithermus]|nr:hypothetical protein B4168_4005 [Anoxybacillus flavithermus]OAO87617.1 hypothetical protein GT23_1266 [Parageobacillus thermoglucosidasius]